MAKKGEYQADKHRDGDPTKPLLSKIEADKRYNQTLYKLNLRLPATYKDLLKTYINTHNKLAAPDDQIESLNTWIKSLIDKELGI